jgi:large subunit ribosomal protein L29
MKVSEVKELSLKELLEKTSAMEEELFNLRFQAKMGQLSNPLRMRMVKRDIARLKTVVTEKKHATSSSQK